MINGQNEMDVTDGKVGHILKPSISSLSSDKIEYICRQITPGEIRHYFQKNPKPFSQIRPGFRAASLSSPDVRHDTVGTEIVAAVHDIQPRVGAAGAVKTLVFVYRRQFVFVNIDVFAATCGNRRYIRFQKREI